MSRIADLGEKNINLPKLIGEYEDALSTIDDNLKLSGKTHDQALKEQATWPIYYSQRRAELKTLMKYLDAQVASVRGSFSRRYNENYSTKLGERMMERYIDNEEAYVKMYELYLEVAELHDKFDAAVDAFDKRGFALRDITAARVAQIQSALL
jgi:hypothetical protein